MGDLSMSFRKMLATPIAAAAAASARFTWRSVSFMVQPLMVPSGWRFRRDAAELLGVQLRGTLLPSSAQHPRLLPHDNTDRLAHAARWRLRRLVRRRNTLKSREERSLGGFRAVL